MKFLNSIVKHISFDLINNNDALKFSNYLNKDISSLELEIEFNEYSTVNFYFSINEGIIKTNYSKIDFDLIHDISILGEELLIGGLKQCQNNNNILEKDGHKKA